MSSLCIALLVNVNQLLALEATSGGGEGASAFDPKFAVFWTIGILTVLAIVLHKFAWPQILAVLDERETSIKESLEAADRAMAESKKIFEDHKRLVAEAREEAQKIVDQSGDAADRLKEKILAEAKSEADATIERAVKEIGLAQQKAMAEIRDMAVDLSLSAAGKIIGRVLDDGDHVKLAKECIDEVDKFRSN